MPRLPRNIRYSFTGGETSPLLVGRSDIEKYYTLVETAENLIVTPFGPIESRSGTRFVAVVSDPNQKVRIVAFQFTSVQGYILEFGNLYMRVYRDGGQVQFMGSPFELVTPYAGADLVDLQFSQSADSLIVVHPNFAPRRITRTADDAWFINVITFSPPPTVETAQSLVTLLGLAANSGSNIAFRAKAANFLNADVGREITNVGKNGLAVITAFDNTSQVKVDILTAFAASITAQATTLSSTGTTVDFSAAHNLAVDDYIVLDSGANAGEIRRVTSITDADTVVVDAAFSANQGAGTAWKKSVGIASGQWLLGGSPNTGLTPSATGPLRALINLDLVVAGWRSGDVGKHVFVNDGIVKITQFTSTTVVKGQVLRTLTGVAQAQGGEWTIEFDAWTTTNGFPRAVTSYESRNIYGGTDKFPNTVWASAKGEPDNMGAGTAANESFSFDLSSPFVDTIQWLTPLRRLFVGTFGAEHIINDGQNDPLSPSNVVVRGESGVGSPHIQPVRLGDSLVFINFHQNKPYLLGFNLQDDSFIANDLFLLSEHLAGDSGSLDRIAFQKEDRPILWSVRSDGVLIGTTVMVRQNVTASCRQLIGGSDGATPHGVVEDVAIIPHWTERRDSVWMVVKRFINGATRRYIEYFDRSLNTDSALTVTGSGIVSVSGLAHLEGQTVWVIGDGVPQARRVVAGGAVSVSPAANAVEVGLEFNSKLVLPTLQYAGVGTMTSLIRRVIKTVIKLHKTAELRINNVDVTPGTPASPFTGDIELEKLGYDKQGKITIERVKPLRLTVLEVAADVAMDDDRR